MKQSWAVAWAAAAAEFWSRAQPTDHFTTSAGSIVAARLVGVIRELDDRLDNPDPFTVVDIGAGNGALLAEIRALAPSSLGDRLRTVGVDLRPAHRELEGIDDVEWRVMRVPDELDLGPVTGLVMAHEWLDEIPCDVVERDPDGVNRLVVVDPTGVESLGPALDDDEACAAYGVNARHARDWLAAWWPLTEPGQRAEVGLERDRAWQWLTEQVSAGAALATDYGHTRDERLRRWPQGTLLGYRSGRVVPPVPNASMNLTAHVSLDSCAAAVPGTTSTSQREMLAPVTVADDAGDPAGRGEQLQQRAGLRRLRDPFGPGAFAWLRWDRP